MLVLLAANIVVGLFVFVGHGSGLGGAFSSRRSTADQAADVHGVDGHGTQVSLSDYRGRWVVVNFFATWCPARRAETPELARFAAVHQADQLAVLGVVHDDSVDASRAFLAAAHADRAVVVDPHDQIADSHLVAAIPASFLIAPDGRVAAAVEGGVRADRLEAVRASARLDTVAGSGAGSSEATGGDAGRLSSASRTTRCSATSRATDRPGAGQTGQPSRPRPASRHRGDITVDVSARQDGPDVLPDRRRADCSR